MRIGFDVSQTGPRKAGCGFYAEGLLHALTECDRKNEYILYPTFGDHFFDPDMDPKDLGFKGNTRIGPDHRSHAAAKAFWSTARAELETELGDPDVIHANNFFAPHGLSRARLIFTLYDLSFLDNCSWTTESNRVGCFEGVFRASIAADWMIAISHYTKDRFTANFPHYPRNRISVIYPASRFVDDFPAEKPPKLRLERRKFWLCVGTLEPRKNYPTILAAYAELRKSVSSTYPLIVAGGPGWMNSAESEVEKLGLRDSVTFLGYVPDRQLCWLYRNATCLVYPSLYEGFGMPVLEAMGCGTPAIAARGSAFPEMVPLGSPSELS